MGSKGGAATIGVLGQRAPAPSKVGNGGVVESQRGRGARGERGTRTCVDPRTNDLLRLGDVKDHQIEQVYFARQRSMKTFCLCRTCVVRTDVGGAQNGHF